MNTPLNDPITIGDHRHHAIYDAGYAAAQAGQDISDNPHEDAAEWEAWSEGWNDYLDELEEETP